MVIRWGALQSARTGGIFYIFDEIWEDAKKYYT